MRRKNHSLSRLLNLLTAFFLSATFGVMGITAALLAGAVPPPAALAPRTLTPLRALALPTLTPSYPPTHTSSPSRTPSLTPSSTATPTSSQTATPTATPTTSFTPTPSPTASPSATPTAPPTSTQTPTPTLTLTQTFTPTAAFPFVLFQTGFTRFQNRADCNFQGISGVVFGLQQERLTARVGLQAQVIGNNFARNVPIESDSTYGWVIQVGERPRRATYRVQLLSREGVILSPAVSVQFDGNCERNLAQVDFTQIRPF
ncbi:MAG: hypothetical protein SNJ58_01170 [Aggregatilineales bacterium]